MKIGSKVTPVNANDKWGYSPAPIDGEVYKISNIFEWKGYTFICLEEFIYEIEINDYKGTIAFNISYFKEVDDIDPLEEQIQEALKAPVPMKLIPA